MKTRRGTVIVIMLLMVLSMATSQTPGRSLLIGGWAPDDVGLLSASGISKITEDSFDLRLLDAVGRRAGLGFSLRPLEQGRIDEEIGNGTIDLALPAVRTSQRDAVAWFSTPYATRSDLLFVRKGTPPLSGQGKNLLLGALRKGCGSASSAARSTASNWIPSLPTRLWLIKW
jgi:ABC-type amino acid transport substrate-binding protein